MGGANGTRCVLVFIALLYEAYIFVLCVADDWMRE